MNVKHLLDAGIRNLDLVFVPAGLPLVSKAGDGPPTTSILVRGGPGTGKTTMAISMAHAIARENDGAVLHLTTEFSPAEVVVKARVLGLDEGTVLSWDQRAEGRVGSVLVQHLTMTFEAEGGESPVTSADQKRRSMEAVWGMLQEPAPSAAPIRAVVIDAFNLPDADEKEAALRRDLVPFIQALEKRGVSTVLVEEAIVAGPDWLAFVTDIVFELSFQADTDTGDLQRKLVCKKSRYAQVTPGPHDYGLDVRRRRPCVLLDPLLPFSGSPKANPAIPEERRASLFIPWTEDGEGVHLHGGALILNAYDRAGRKLTIAVHRTAGVHKLMWECGPLSTLTIGNLRARFHSNEGPYAACDAILAMVNKAKGNAVVIQDIGALTTSSRYRTGLPRVLEALRSHGCLVLLHGTSDELASFSPFANISAQQEARGTFRSTSPRYCPATVHLPSIDLLSLVLRRGNFESFPSEQDGILMQEIVERARVADKARSPEEIESALGKLSIQWDEISSAAWSPSVATAYFLLSVMKRRLGVQNDPRVTSPLSDAFATHTALHAPLAWALSVSGNELGAAYWSLQAFEETGANPTNDLLWLGVQSVYARNPDALEEVLRLTKEEPWGPLFVGFALRALVRQNRASEIENVVTDYVQRHPLPSFQERRLRVEPLLDARDMALREKARDELLVLADLPDVPALYRAEILYNLGYAHERLGKLDEARGCYERARQENPHLSLASEALARFDKPQPPVPSAGPPSEAALDNEGGEVLYENAPNELGSP